MKRSRYDIKPVRISDEEFRRLNEWAKNNPFFYSFNKYVTKCPNDGAKLELVGPFCAAHGPRKTTYTEGTECPKCGCHVSRKPSYKDIRDYERRSKQMRIGAPSKLEIAVETRI